MQTAIQQTSVVHADETSWYVGKPDHWLWVFTNEELTYYVVDESRSRKVVEEVLGEDFAGVLVSDCLVVYDDVCQKQQKCYAHHLRAIAQAKELQTNSAYLQTVERMLKSAMAVKALQGQLSGDKYDQYASKLELQADQLLLPSRADPLEEKIANRLRKQRNHLFTFLYHSNVEATNNQAERQLRPAVIARKLSCGNRTIKGYKPGRY